MTGKIQDGNVETATKKNVKQGAAIQPMATNRPWEVIGIKRTRWFTMASSGRTPAPTAKLGARCSVWMIAELEQWLKSGCPCREVWEQQKKGGGA